MKSIFLTGNMRQILFLIIVLAIVLLIMSYLKTGGKSTFLSSDLPEFDEPTKVIDNKYYNKIYQFGISKPDANWEFGQVQNMDTLRKQNNTLPLLSNLNVLLHMLRRDLDDTLAVIKVGIIDLIAPRTSQSLAEQSLKEVGLSSSTHDSVRVIRGATLSGSGKFQGAYYMIEHSKRAEHCFPIWIVMFVVHNQFAYTTLCQVRSQNYEFLRTDLEKILTSFRLYQS